MEFLNQTYIALRGPQETQQSSHETISRLADRLAQSTQLEDRRAALLSLRGLSRDYRADLGNTALDALLAVLEGDAQVDPDIAKAVLQTLNTLCEVDTEQAQQAQSQAQTHGQQNPNQPHPPTAAELRETALRNTDKVLADPKHTRQLFGLVNDQAFYTRFGALEFLNTLIGNRRTVVQSHFVNAPEYSQTITAVLEEKRDIIRNEGLQLFQSLIAQNTDIQTVFAFGGAFESLLRIIAQEGGVEGGVTSYSCLIAIEGLLRYNSSTQTYFRELLPALPPLLLFPPTISPDQETPQEFSLQFWDEQKAKNSSLVISIIGTMKAPEHIRLLTELGIASNAPTFLKSQALTLLSGYLQPPPLFRPIVPYNPVPDTNDEEWDRLEPCRGIDLLVLTTVDGEYGGIGKILPTDKESMNLRGIALSVFDDFVKDEEAATELLNRMLPASAAGATPAQGTTEHPNSVSAAKILMSTISTLPTSPLSSSTAARLQFASLVFAAFFHGPPNHSNTSPKAIARGLSTAPASSGEDGGNFFVPADGGPPPSGADATKPSEEPEEEDEPPSSLLQLLTEHLSLSLLAKSKAIDDVLEARSWDKVIVGYLILLCTWLWEDPKSVRIFLEGGGIGVLVEPISQTSGMDVLVQGLCTLLFGICYHFNREPGEITRKTLHSIITRLGADHLISRMARVRDDDRFRHVSPESIILPLPYQLVTLNSVTEGEIWLDWGFVEFWKANYYTVQRGMTADPDTVVTGPGDTAELQLVISSLRDVVRKQADELQAAKTEVTQLKQQAEQQPPPQTVPPPPKANAVKNSGPAVEELKKKLAELQAEHEKEREALLKEKSDLATQLSEAQEKKKEQEKEQEDLLVFLEELSEKRKRDKAAMKKAGLEVSEDEGGGDDDDE